MKKIKPRLGVGKSTEGRATDVDDDKGAPYYREVIREAAHRLRVENVGHMIATDLEDSLSWSSDPKTCAHPYWYCLPGGATACRTCLADTSNMEEMGG